MATNDWTEEDVDLAREYRNLLVEIAQLRGSSDWTEEDVDQARDYSASLREICELKT